MHTHLFTHMHTHTPTQTTAHNAYSCTHTCTQDGFAALYFAVTNGHEDVVNLLLGVKADPNLSDMVMYIVSSSAAAVLCP